MSEVRSEIQPIYAELQAENAALKTVVLKLESRIAELEALVVKLETRGALIPALNSMCLNQNECLRTRVAIQKGAWSIQGLLKRFHTWVAKCTAWKPLHVAGYNIKAIDTTCIYRPRLQKCTTKHFNSTAGKSLPAIPFSMLSAMGKIGQQKAGLLLQLTRGDERANTEETLMAQGCGAAKEFVSDKDILTADRKFPVMVILEGGIKNVVIRRATNFTVTRVLTEKDKNEKSIGRPRKQGVWIRPLGRIHKKRVHPASEPDEVQTWTDEQGNTLEAKIWRNVLLSVQRTWSEERKTLNAAQKWVVMVIKHPKYPVPMVVLMNVELMGEEASQVMRGRWGVEQMPFKRSSEYSCTTRTEATTEKEFSNHASTERVLPGNQKRRVKLGKTRVIHKNRKTRAKQSFSYPRTVIPSSFSPPDPLLTTP